MPVSFVAASSVSTGSNPSVSVPAGITAGDLLIIIQTATTNIPTLPTGWRRLFLYGIFSDPKAAIFYKFAGASESAVTLSVSDTTSSAVMVAYRGAAGFDHLGTLANAGSTNMVSFSSTTSLNNDYVVHVWTSRAGAASTLTTAAGTTSRVNSSTTTTNNGLLVADELVTTAGTTTQRVANQTASRSYTSFSFSIAESSNVRYWVGGNGTWDTTNTTNWSTTSGGGGGASVPTASTDVVIDGNSGSPTITLSGSPSCRFLTTLGSSCTFTSTGTLTVNNSLRLSATTTWSATGLLTFTSNAFIDTNGVTLSCPITFNGSSRRFTLHNNLTTLETFTFTNGILDTWNFGSQIANSKETADSGYVLTCRIFSSNNTNTRQLVTYSRVAITGNNATVLDVNKTNLSRNNSQTDSTVLGTSWALTYNGSTGTRTINFTGTNFLVDLLIQGGSDTITGPIASEALNFTGFSGTWSMGVLSTAGDVTLTPEMTVIHNNTTWTFQTGSSQDQWYDFITANKTFYSININTTTQNGLRLMGNLNLEGGFNCPGSAFDAATYNVTANFFRGRCQLNPGFFMGSGTWTLTGTDASAQSIGANSLNKVWKNDQTQSNVSLWNSGTANIVFTDTSNSTKTFENTEILTTLSYNNVTFTGGSSTAQINLSSPSTGILSFKNFTSTRSSAYTITITGGAQVIVDSFNVSGSSGNLVTVTSNSTTNATLSSRNNARQTGINFTTFNFITATPTPNSTGTIPYYWYIGNNSSKNSSTTGVVLTSDSSYMYYSLTSGTTWVVPSDWNSSVNNVYLIGGGGGGGGNAPTSSFYASGGGGGGGGFRVLNNVVLTPGSVVSYTIGAGGNGGNGSTTNANATSGTSGGNTTFINTNASNTAGGGGPGSGNNTAGTGGTGTTSGGSASFGTASFANTQWAGGSGGGSGGLNQAGGDGSGTTGGQGNGGVSNTLFVLDYGDGGNGPAAGANNGNPGLNFGGGGSGAAVGTTAITRTGGAGTAGAIVIRYQLASATSAGGRFMSFFF